MTLRAWRIIMARHVRSAFTGRGAREWGGRWNSIGVPVVYTSQSRALAALEFLAHLEADSHLRAYRRSYRLIDVRFDRRLVEELDLSALSADWRATPCARDTQQLGDQWAAEQRSVVLRVPSAVIPDEYNYVLNPEHPQFGRVQIGTPMRFEFDPRLIERH